jgi:aspartyl-tRNA(Asn)/glutamyl-tRNA(Gln) amidotransferase subunit A
MVHDPTSLTAVELGVAYRRGDLRPTGVAEAYLEVIGPGPIYRQVLAERAREQARRAERQFDRGVDVGPLQGIPLALKDLLDVEGTVAPAVARLDAAGAVFLGKTNMTELAFSGVGINPHFGTPPNAFDPERIPGGSSSGSAVAVAAGMACAAIGSDTGGSVRIPAAFNGLFGLKTSEGAIPIDGCVPLSFTLDTIGPIARTPADAWMIYRALAALAPAPLPPLPARLRLLAPTTVVLDDLAPEANDAYCAAVAGLRQSGHEVVEQDVPLFREILETTSRYGSFAAHEALALHEELIDRHGPEIDPRVAGRIVLARGRSSTDYLRLVLARRRWQREFWETAGIDAVIAPTVPILPPRIADLETDEAYFEANRLCLRNTTLFNQVGGTAISFPVGSSPVGVMVAASAGNEGLVVAIAESLTGP